MDSNLVKFTEKPITNNEELSHALENVKKHTISLFPEMLNFGARPEFKITGTLVSVDTTLVKGNNRDVYSVGSGQYALHLNKINEIAQASGVVVTDSKVMERTVDADDGLVTYISHQVKGKVRAIDGSIKEDVATGRYDYYKDLASGKSEKQVAVSRSFADSLAESNARTRLFNKLVMKLPQSFSLEELSKPFFVPCVIEDKNELIKSLPKNIQDQVNEDYVRKTLGISSKIYGTPAIQEAEPKSQTEPEPEKTPANFTQSDDATFEELPNETHAEEKKGAQIDSDEQYKIIAGEFREVSQEERTTFILKLVNESDWQHPKGIAVTKARIESVDLDRQIEIISDILKHNNEEKL